MLGLADRILAVKAAGSANTATHAHRGRDTHAPLPLLTQTNPYRHTQTVTDIHTQAVEKQEGEQNVCSIYPISHVNDCTKGIDMHTHTHSHAYRQTELLNQLHTNHPLGPPLYVSSRQGTLS